MLILSLSTWLNSFLNLSSFCVSPYSFLYTVSYFIFIKRPFYLFLSNLDPFYFFLDCFLWLGLPILCWIEVVRVSIHVLFKILAGELSISSRYYIGGGFVIKSFLLGWDKVPTIPTLVSMMNRWWIYQITFFCTYWNDHVVFVFTFIDVVYHSNLYTLNHPCEPGMNPTWSWHVVFLCVTGFSLLIALLRMLHLYSSRILACHFSFW